MIARRFAIVSSFLSRINSKKTIQKLSTSSKTADPSLLMMDPKPKKTQQFSKSHVTASPSLSKIDLREAMKMRNDGDLLLTGKLTTSLSTSETASPSLSKNTDLVITSPSLSNIDVGEAMKKQNDVAMFLAEKVISVVAKNSNFVFSPASINALLTMVAATSNEE
ncbi:predicted protein [Arabidopsis lyrata subsp. lyrata]|uniref:Predicted protein n=1 Tax=Arabidopsis lyrata subsp. lyrata TaxID=81972 RepID=D7KSW4_ARALL|nr:predicted protein [Arabidopsis lyrata subsp. lyrata]